MTGYPVADPVTNAAAFPEAAAPDDVAETVWRAVMLPSPLSSDHYAPFEVPLMLSRDEAHLFSAVWRDGARESKEDMENGDFVVFDSNDPDDVVRWLTDPDG